MLVISIDNKDYECPQEWSDVTLKQYCDSIAVFNTMPKKLNTLIFGSDEEKEKIEVNEDDVQDFASFYKRWVAFWCEIPEGVVGKLPVEIEDGIGVINLYNILLKFMITPSGSSLPVKDFIIYKNGLYMLPESQKKLNGESQPMYKSSFDEFYEAAEIKRVAGELKDGNSNVLPLLVAILYRPAKAIRKGFFKKIVGYEIEAYDSDKVKKRATLFEEMPMDLVWGAYFFFLKLRLTFIENSLNSLKEEMEKQAKLASMDGI
jgi:hypothetical protein